jgi:predicted ATPase
LASSIAWTYQFLPTEAQIALRRLAVFRGEFEIDAATVVVAGGRLDDAASAKAIRTLFEQNLLSFDDGVGRVNMAPAIRVFAEERLADSDDLTGARARHGQWFAALAERFDGQTMPLSLLAPDESDVLAALETSMAGADPSVALRILATLGAQWRNLGYPEVADRAAAWLCTRTPSDGEERWAGAVARLCLAQSGDPGAAIHAFADEALAIAELAGDERTVEVLESAAHHHDPATVGTVR